MARKPLLSLDTFQSDLFITIDGTNYPLAGQKDVGFMTWARITRLQRQINELNEKEDKDESDWAELDRLVDEMFSIVMPTVPDGVRAGLNSWQKLAACEAFTNAVTPKTRKATKPGAPRNR